MEEIKRIVHEADALAWLEASPVLVGHSFIASLPDVSEFHTSTLEEWKSWFVKTAMLILSRTPDDGVTLFFQSDIKREGTWVDKGYLCLKAAENAGHELLFHKIFCRVEPNRTTFGRPAYSHLLAFSKNVRADVGKSTPDVISDLGEKIWERGMGFEACSLATKFIKEETSSHTLVNPFCGQGSMLAMANAFELNAIGIERSPKRANLARKLKANLHSKTWET